jgi:hypothetical protein
MHTYWTISGHSEVLSLEEDNKHISTQMNITEEFRNYWRLHENILKLFITHQSSGDVMQVGD